MLNPSMHIQTESIRVTKAFDGFFKIPPHQRDFSWEADDQITRLWEDLIACWNYDKLHPGQELGHFLGSLVVISRSATDDYHQPQEVIDGQQRLTSLTLLARAMLDRAPTELTDNNERNTACAMLNRMLFEQVHTDTHAKVRLNRDDEFYYKSIVEFGTHEDRKSYWESEGVYNATVKTSAVRNRIVRALDKFNELIEETLANIFRETSKAKGDGLAARSEAFNEIIHTLCSSFYVLKIVVTDIRMAYRLFETLNERGLDLSQADLVKNVLLETGMRTGGQSQHDEISDLWNEMLDHFDKQDPQKLTKIPHLIQYSFSSRHESIKSESLFDDISSAVQGGAAEKTAIALTQQLVDDSACWNAFLDTPNKWSPEAKLRSNLIVGPLWKQHATPLLMRIYKRFHRSTTQTELETCLKGVENYLFREGIVNKASVAVLERVLSEAARMINESSKTPSDLLSLLNSESEDKTFVNQFALASAKTNKLGFYVMWRIENHLMTSGQAITGLSPERQGVEKNHLEHIMPKNPSAGWNGIELDPDFSSNINRFGNLLILASKDNVTLSNSSFQEKMDYPADSNKSYRAQPFETVKEVVNNTGWLEAGKWSFGSIEKRQRHLADKYALDIWSLT